MPQREPSTDDVEPSQPVASIAAVGDELDPAQFGRWDPAASVTFPIVAIHAVMLPTGKVMIFAFPQNPRQNSAQAWIWDPVTGVKTRKDPPAWIDPKDGQTKAANIWCSGHTFTADGELVVFGGNLEFESATSSWKGLNKVYTFNAFAPNGGSWQEQPDMRHGRWYPTGVRMADGRIPITSGLNEVGDLDPADERHERGRRAVHPRPHRAAGDRQPDRETSYDENANCRRPARPTRTCSPCPPDGRWWWGP